MKGMAAQTGKPPKGYKFTEVGLIPDDWTAMPLQKTCRGLYRGASPRPIADPRWFNDRSSIGWVRISDVTQSRRYLLATTQRLSDEGIKRSRLIPRGSLIMSICATVGRPIETAVDACIHDGFVVFEQPEIHQGFLYHLLCDLEPQWSQKGQTGSQMNLNTNLIKITPIAVPPPEEQRAIAEALSDVDEFIGSLEKLIAKKQDIKQAAMQQLLTCKIRLPGFTGKWETKRLGETATLKARIGWQGLTTGEYLDSGHYYLITGTEFSRGYIDWNSCYFVDESRYKQDKHIQLKLHDVLVTKDGTIGKVALISELPAPATLNSGVFVIRPIGGSFHPEFFYYLLCSSVFEEFLNQLSAGSTINHLYQKDFVGFKYKTPPSLDEQAEIAAILASMDKEITALEGRLDKTRQIKQGMMQQLLTGRIRLVKPSVAKSEKATEKASSRKANVYFIRSVLAAEIIDQLHEQPTFGHVKFEKMMFLVEHLCEVDTGSTYYRKAAGPYDNRALRSIDSQLRAQQWFDARKEGKRYQYAPMQKRGGHKRYFDRYFSGIEETFDRIIGTFKTLDTERCEIVATLLAAWSDLLRKNGTVSDELIVHEVLNNWHEAKRRIPEDRWLKALDWMRSRGFVPKGAA